MIAAFWTIRAEEISLSGQSHWVKFEDGSMDPKVVTIPVGNIAIVEWL